ncbi:hypothetical protein Tco_0925109 [Tanacetum coccineum]|uniref:Uncharacterized protein n=1 Tax=Tanacetum coccineum TaxID=301880 RepID=A0ABQ5D763_9ASTR
MESLNSNSQESELHQLQQMQDKAKENCMVSFRLHHSHLKVLSDNDLKGTRIKRRFERVFVSLFGQDVQTFTGTMLLNLDQLEKHLAKENFKNLNPSMHLERMNDRKMQSKEGNIDSSKALDAGLAGPESKEIESEKHVTSSRFGNDTYAEDAVIKPVNDKEPMAEVQLTAQHNVLANEQQHYVQSKPIYDTYLLEKVDSNTILDSTNMCHRGGEIDQDAKKCQVSCRLLDPSFDNMTTKFLNQSLKQHGQILNETSNKAKIKREINILETINIELENSVAKLLAENEKLHKENEHLKQTYKDLYDSIKKTRVQTKDLNDSLIAQVNIDVNNDLPKPVTPHYLPKVRESVLAKPHHVIAPGSSRNRSKELYGSIDMAHNYYLEEAKKKTQDKNRNLKPREMPFARTHHTPNACIPKPRSNNQTSRNWPASKSCEEKLKAMKKADHSRNPSSFSDFKNFVCSTCQKCVFNANLDACITKFLKEIVTGHRFSPNKSSDVHEKPNTPRSCLRWIPTGRIFNTVGLRWVPTGKTFTSSITMVDCEPPNGSNKDITNPYESNKTLNVSASTLNLVQSLSGSTYISLYSNSLDQKWQSHMQFLKGRMVNQILEPALHEITLATLSSGLVPNPPPLTPFVPPSRHEWDLVFQPVFDEFFSPLASVASLVHVEEAPAPVESTGSPSSTIVDQDAPSPSTLQTKPQSQSQTILLCAEEESHDLEVAHMSNDPYFSIPIPETVYEESSSSDVISTTVHSDAPILEHLSKWTKDCWD